MTCHVCPRVASVNCNILQTFAQESVSLAASGLEEINTELSRLMSPTPVLIQVITLLLTLPAYVQPSFSTV